MNPSEHEVRQRCNIEGWNRNRATLAFQTPNPMPRSAIRHYLTSPHPAVVGVRLFLAAVFLLYGLVKMTGGQFVYDWTQQTFTRNGPNGHLIIWYFFGYSRVYGTFIGLCEIVPALMLLWPRTALLGTAILFGVAVNVAVMDFAFNVPPGATWSVVFYAALCAGLLWHERARLLGAFFSVQEEAVA